MSIKKWTIIDGDSNTHVDQLLLRPVDVGGPAQGYSVAKHTLKGGLRENVAAVRVDNGTLAFELLATRGMGIWKAWIGDEEIGWQSPIAGPVHPSFVPLAEPSGLGWLDGFDELLVRCGLESNGAPEFNDQGKLVYGLHGRIANRPAERVEIEIDNESGELKVTGDVTETRFLFRRLRLRSATSTRVGETVIRIRDELINESDQPTTVQMLYHVNFGTPLLETGSRFVAPVAELAPRDPRAAEGLDQWSTYGDAEAGYAEQVYFMKLATDADGRSFAALRNAAGTRAVLLRFSTDQLPCFTLWKNTAGRADGYVTGLEPGTNFPNVKSYEQQQNRVVSLEPGQTYPIDLEMEVVADANRVAELDELAKQIQPGDPTIHRQPQPGWSV